MKTIKKSVIFVISSIFAAVSFTACTADDNIVEIPLKKIPDLGLRMVKAYFPSNSVVKAVKNNTKDMKNRTCVLLDNEATIDFDKDGNWLIVDCHTTSVPTRMVPGLIQMYLNKNKPGVDVVYMGRIVKNGDMTILLKDGTELHFTSDQKIIE